MWSTRSLLHLKQCLRLTRTFLTESYSCTEAWNQRLQSPILSKIKPRDFFIEIDSRLQTTGKLGAIDVDIYANTVNHIDSVDETINVLHRFRMTANTSDTFDSTHHAIIRYLLDCNDTETLLHILDDRLNYGIFPDHLCYNLMMDKFIKAQDYVSAAKVATFLMLQEDNDHPICNALAVYSCYKFLENPDAWVLPPPEPEIPDDEKTKIRVFYLRNPFFDDHFDLREPKHLVGKTLVFFGKYYKDTPLGRTCMLRGFILHEKYDEAVKLIDHWIQNSTKEVIFKDTLPLINKELDAIPEEKINDNVKVLQEKIKELEKCSLKDGSIMEEIEMKIKEAVETRTAKDIEHQLSIYKQWDEKRMAVLTAQLKELDKEKRLAQIKEIKEDLAKRERLLTFYENEEKLELQIEKKLKWEEEVYGPPVEQATILDEDYIPPDVTSKPAIQNK
ncbi:uncharacterized protein [Chelonus insularis]|uniref:uncharacterized protein n=1 Tax=Chelonus insularis TaxID=460826 RepID=UPI00158AA9BB|nr:uncharacterized protein LOC118065771 [Chelonus insularis]